MATNSLDDLMVFVRVVELRSFAAVGESLGMPGSAISKQIKRLEKNIGARLLNRTTHGVSPTEVGRAIFDHAYNILLEAKSIDGVVSGFQNEPLGLLHVAAPVAFGNDHIVPLLPEFQLRYPDVRISLDLSNQYVDVAENGIDLVIRIANDLKPNLMARPLAAVRYLLCASPAYLGANGKPRSPADLQQHRCLIYGRLRTQDTWHFTDAAGDRLSVRVSGPVVVNSTQSLRQLALQDQGIALLPSFSVAADLNEGRLLQVLPEVEAQGQFGDTLYAAYLPNPFLSPKVRVFIDYLVEKFAVEKV
ncbi:LysR family transcriptional regulator [Noviherbaspirillum malthae]|uniref:LysR family transcriptional regulator n=1 Tax=Noviherbaspirillum malthae TaxID=1260987 RepID=UPI00188F264C|nr:LysR family transcriptional regulator [Noviherbaspirillum malthae]